METEQIVPQLRRIQFLLVVLITLVTADMVGPTGAVVTTIFVVSLLVVDSGL